MVYHKIDPKPELGLTCIHPHTFERQIKYLLSLGFQFVTISKLNQNRESDKKQIAICFDDGYMDVYEHAYPILKKYSIPATVFIIVNFIGKKNTWDVNLGGIHYEHLGNREIQELIGEGWEIGSHSMSHYSLKGMNAVELEYQLLRSKMILEDIFSTVVKSLAPPFGNLTDRVRYTAFEYGYQFVTGFFPLKYYTEAVPKGVMLRLAVYRSDRLNSIKNKLADNQRLYPEMLKQNIINFCSNATILVKTLR